MGKKRGEKKRGGDEPCIEREGTRKGKGRTVHRHV